MRQTLSILVNNHPGVLSHVAGLFTRRGYNIESIAAGTTEDPTVTRITIVAQGDENQLQQVAKQIRKLYDVREVLDLRYSRSVTRELVLVTVYADRDRRPEVVQMASALDARVVDLSEQTVTIEFSGNEHRIRNLLALCEGYGIKQMARTGMIALPFEWVEEAWEPML
ncbi:MAG: acetolactate synthase small subunit [Nitrospinota bacterium]